MTASQATALCAWLEARFCRSTVEIRAHVAAEFGLNYSHSGCIKLLARLGFEYRKPKPLPRVASAEKQAAFIAMYERLMRDCQQMKPCTSPMRCIRNTRPSPHSAG